ncbi:amino acid permease-domain-containing protein [Scheffersomyces amazonensis]|uniref:amino acid permease-domain-containing protein n=1 Tax=Scheffersomyces amazonensis TaxID=1078765 RepID=UPI00315CD09A
MVANSSEKDKTTVKIHNVTSIGEGVVEYLHSRHSNGEGPANSTYAVTRKALESAQADLELAKETGYKPELRRNFSVFALLGVGFGITNSWFGISASLITSISSGGPMMVVYGIIIVAFISSFIAITLSELISAMPNAGGQYYWTKKLAPRHLSGFASYMCGLFSWAASVFISASICLSIASSVVGMYLIYHPDTEFQTWIVFLVYELTNLFLTIFNIWEKPLPFISQSALYVSLGSFFIITVIVLVKSGGEFQSAHFVFVEFTNGTGWSSGGIAFIVGLINPNWSFSCLDAATHLAEESSDPRRKIPIAIIGTVVIGLITSLSYSIAMFFCIKDLETLFNSRTGVPIMDIYYQVLGSKAGAVGLEFLVFLTAIGCNVTCHTWQARLCWTIARDNGLPGSRYWSRVNKKTGLPVNAHLMSCFWSAVIGCIYMGSSTAYNSMIIGGVVFQMLAYSIPVTFLLINGRDSIKHGPFWLGKIGLFSNWVTLGWTVFTTVFYSFPPVMPVTGGNMNYVSVVIGVFAAYCVIYWIARGRYKFTSLEERENQIEQLTRELSPQVSTMEHVFSNEKEV